MCFSYEPFFSLIIPDITQKEESRLTLSPIVSTIDVQVGGIATLQQRLHGRIDPLFIDQNDRTGTAHAALGIDAGSPQHLDRILKLHDIDA